MCMVTEQSVQHAQDLPFRSVLQPVAIRNAPLFACRGVEDTPSTQVQFWKRNTGRWNILYVTLLCVYHRDLGKGYADVREA